MTIVHKAAFARAVGISKSRVSQYVRMGLPVTADGKIDLEAGRRWIAERVEPMRRMDYQINHRRTDNREDHRRGLNAEALETLRLGDDVVLAFCKGLLNNMQANVAVAVVEGGGSCRVAYFAANLSLMIASDQLVHQFREFKIGPFADDPNPRWIDVRKFVEPPWARLAEIAGEALDLAAWQQYAIDRQYDKFPDVTDLPPRSPRTTPETGAPR